MRMMDRRLPRPKRLHAAAPTTVDIDRMLHWVADEVRAERRFTWYISRCPARFIARHAPSVN